MFNVNLKGALRSTDCEGITRRDMLKVGGLGLFGLSLPGLLQARAAQAVAKVKADDPKVEGVIVLWCQGGPSHLDTFDLKPDSSSEYRGEFQPIETNVSGIQISEHLPKTAQVMDKFAIIRSLHSPIAAHQQATDYMLTGYRPLPTLKYPSYGAVVAKELGVRENLPPYVAMPGPGRGGQAGFIGAGYSAFAIGNPSGRNYRVPNITLRPDVDHPRLARRRSFLTKSNKRFIEGMPDDNIRSVDKFYEQAYDLVTSEHAKKAFDLSQEPDSLREKYGRHIYGQGALLARRMIEAGVRFVLISSGGWDTHRNNWDSLKTRQLPPIDQAWSALLADLDDRGTLDKTMVLMLGEFGRTPKINTTRGGRDHWSRCRFVNIAGGGVQGGQVIGSSDATGGVPADNPITIEDVATTVYDALGVDYKKQYITPTGRPIRLAMNGRVIDELYG